MRANKRQLAGRYVISTAQIRRGANVALLFTAFMVCMPIASLSAQTRQTQQQITALRACLDVISFKVALYEERLARGPARDPLYTPPATEPGQQDRKSVV